MKISIFGKNGSGKTTIATHLAKYLSDKDKSAVAIISLEERYGSLQRTLGIKVEKEKSIINALTQDDILKYFVRYEEGIHILTLTDTDDITRYDVINNIAVENKILDNFLKNLEVNFDYTIFDLSELLIDHFTFYILKNSDKLINVIESRPEGISFYESHKKALESMIDKKDNINVLNKHEESIINKSSIEDLCGNIDICLNFDFNITKNERENKLNKDLISNMKLFEQPIFNNNTDESGQKSHEIIPKIRDIKFITNFLRRNNE